MLDASNHTGFKDTIYVNGVKKNGIDMPLSRPRGIVKLLRIWNSYLRAILQLNTRAFHGGMTSAQTGY